MLLGVLLVLEIDVAWTNVVTYWWRHLLSGHLVTHARERLTSLHYVTTNTHYCKPYMGNYTSQHNTTKGGYYSKFRFIMKLVALAKWIPGMQIGLQSLAEFSDPATLCTVFFSTGSAFVIGSSFCFLCSWALKMFDLISWSFLLFLLYAQTPSTEWCPVLLIMVGSSSGSCNTNGNGWWNSPRSQHFHQPRTNFSQFAVPNIKALYQKCFLSLQEEQGKRN